MTRANRARSLGAALLDLRTRAALSLRAVAIRLDVHHTTVGRWEAGTFNPTIEQVEQYLDAVGADVDERDRIIKLAAGHEDTDWLISGPAGINPQLAAVMDYENTATSIFEWAPLVVPGLLQIQDYAAAIVNRSSASIEPREARNRVMMRMARQSALTRVDPTNLHAVIGTPAIHGRIGGQRVMAAQLSHLVRMGDRNDHKNVTIQAYDPSASEEWTPAHAGPFIIYEFDGVDPVVYLEHHRSGAFLTDRKEVDAYKAAAEIIRRVAMNPEESAEFIASVIPCSMETI